jgi:hypothetical protein
VLPSISSLSGTEDNICIFQERTVFGASSSSRRRHYRWPQYSRTRADRPWARPQQ